MVGEGWPLVPLGEVANFVMGQSPPSSTVKSTKVGLPFLQGNAEFGETFPTPHLYCSISLRVSQKHDLLISVRAPVGEINSADQSYVIGRGLAAIRFHSLNRNFGYYAVEHSKKHLKLVSQGSTFDAVGKDNLHALLVPKPDHIEQKRIAQILDTLDDAIRHTRALLEKLKLTRAGLLHDLLIRGVDELGQLRPARAQAPELYRFHAELGWVPLEWEVGGLESKQGLNKPVLRTGPFGSSLKGEHWRNQGTPVITIGSLMEGVIDKSALLFIDAKKTEQMREYWVEEGDLVFSRVADIGRLVPIGADEQGWVMSSNLMRISLDKRRVVPEISYYILSSDHRIRDQLNKFSNSAGRDVVNSAVLRSLVIAWPTFDEQKRIRDIMLQTQKSYLNWQLELSKLETLKTALMDDLLTGRVRVPLELEPVSP